jgi:hypothetical protein
MAARLLYQRGVPLIAVRHVHLGQGVSLVPGQPVPAGMREFQRRSLFTRRMVGRADCLWAAALVAGRVPPAVPTPAVPTPEPPKPVRHVRGPKKPEA